MLKLFKLKQSNEAIIVYLSYTQEVFQIKFHYWHPLVQVRASESLMKLISDIKQYLILNDFPSVNEAIAKYSKGFDEESVNVYNWINIDIEIISLYLSCPKRGKMYNFLTEIQWNFCIIKARQRSCFLAITGVRYTL